MRFPSVNLGRGADRAVPRQGKADEDVSRLELGEPILVDPNAVRVKMIHISDLSKGSEDVNKLVGRVGIF